MQFLPLLGARGRENTLTLLTHTHVHMYARTHTHAHTHACTHTCMRAHTHTHTHACAHTHTHTHTHAHTPSPPLPHHQLTKDLIQLWRSWLVQTHTTSERETTTSNSNQLTTPPQTLLCEDDLSAALPHSKEILLGVVSAPGHALVHGHAVDVRAQHTRQLAIAMGRETQVCKRYRVC